MASSVETNDEEKHQKLELEYQKLVSEFVFPKTLFSRKQLKELKVPSRECAFDLICTACSRGFKDVAFVREHITAKTHAINKRAKQLEQTLPLLSTPTAEELYHLTIFVEDVYQQHSALKQGQTAKRADVVMQLEGLVQQQFPDVSVGLHGSSLSGFALDSSDVNINLSIPESSQNKTLIPTVMKAALTILRSNDTLYTGVKEDFFSFNKIPKILFKHKESGLTCEVRANAGNPMSLAQLLRLYSSIDERVLKIGVAFRYWSRVCGVDIQENGHYPSHMFVVMVIHYLQQISPPVLPVLHERYPDLLKVPEATGVEEFDLVSLENIAKVSGDLHNWQVTNQQSLGELWHGLLRYYAVEFDISKFAVSICQLEPLVRLSRMWGATRLAVEDPMIPRNNLAKAAASDRVFMYMMSSLKQTCAYFSNEDKNAQTVAVGPAGHRLSSESRTEITNSSIEVEDSAIIFAAFGPKNVLESPTEDSDFVFQSEASSPGAAEKEPVEGNNPLASSPNKNQETQSPVDVDSIEFGSFRDESDVSSSKDEQEKRDVSSIMDTQGGEEDCSCEGEITQRTSEENLIEKQLQEQKKEQVKEQTQEQVKEQVKKQVEEKSLPFGEAVDATTVQNSDVPVCNLLRRNLVFHDYPTACLNCKRKGHIATRCPDDLLDLSSSLPKTTPSDIQLKEMSGLFKSYMKSVSPSREDMEERQMICEAILSDIKRIYPGARLELFGSSANGFGLKKSDLDMCLVLPSHNYPDAANDKTSQSEVILAVAHQLEKCRGYDKILAITSARVPIVKFAIPRFQLQCDISLENRLALRNTRMLLAYANIDIRVKLLGYVVKHFAKVCDIGDASSGSLSSYAYILLVLHYLQRTSPPVVPVLQKLRHASDRSSPEELGPIINTWNCYYFEPTSDLAQVWPGLNKNKESVAKLWLGFLRYFLKFDWTTQVVTIRQQEPLTKVDKWWISKQMCIEDPFNLDHNLAGPVSGKMRAYILERFVDALKLHTQRIRWRSINHLMDKNKLVGNSRVPKFLICNNCNQRGHKAQYCPKAANRRGTNSVSQTRRQTSQTSSHPSLPQNPLSSFAGVPHSAVRIPSYQVAPTVHPPTRRSQSMPSPNREMDHVQQISLGSPRGTTPLYPRQHVGLNPAESHALGVHTSYYPPTSYYAQQADSYTQHSLVLPPTSMYQPAAHSVHRQAGAQMPLAGPRPPFPNNSVGQRSVPSFPRAPELTRSPKNTTP